MQFPAIQRTFCAAFVLLTLLPACDSGKTVGQDEQVEERPAFYVEGRHLYDPCGEEVVLRGVNKMVVYMDRRGSTFPEIAKTGANVVRTMWRTEVPPSEADFMLGRARQNGLIPMLEMHNATGDWSRLDDVVDYWLRPETIALIQKHEKYLLVNIANEAGQNVPDTVFREKYADIIRRMRRAGVRTPIVVDASGWGRNYEQLLTVGPWLVEQDSLQSTILSVHWWHSDNNRARITDALERSVDLDLPFIIGEFAHKEVGCRGTIAYQHLLAEAQRLGIGWLAWSWGPGNADCAEMDMTEDGRFETLHDWGLSVAVTDENSISNTSKRPGYISRGSCNR